MLDLTRLNNATTALNVSANRVIDAIKANPDDQAAVDAAAAAVEAVTTNLDAAVPPTPAPAA